MKLFCDKTEHQNGGISSDFGRAPRHPYTAVSSVKFDITQTVFY